MGHSSQGIRPSRKPGHWGHRLLASPPWELNSQGPQSMATALHIQFGAVNPHSPATMAPFSILVPGSHRPQPGLPPQIGFSWAALRMGVGWKWGGKTEAKIKRVKRGALPLELSTPPLREHEWRPFQTEGYPHLWAWEGYSSPRNPALSTAIPKTSGTPGRGPDSETASRLSHGVLVQTL